MSAGAVPGWDAAVEAARDALVRRHHEMFRAAQAAVGVEPMPYDEVSDRTKRLKHQQLDPQADAALAAGVSVVLAFLADDIRSLSAAAEYSSGRTAHAAAACVVATYRKAITDEH